MNKFVVYTVLVGNYDDILQPKVVDSRFDYILFTNNTISDNLGVWKPKEFPLAIENDNIRFSRYPKSHPESLLSDYAASLYIDANIQIQDQWVYDRFVELYNQEVEYAGIQLIISGDDCIYEHTLEICQKAMEHDYMGIKQSHRLFELGFPSHYGLNENNVIFRMHTEKMKNTDEEWWWWIVNYSFRDQFSYMYCLRKYNVSINYFLPKGEDTRNGTHFKLFKHDNNRIRKIKFPQRSLFERLRLRSRSLSPPQKSKEMWLKSIKSSYPMLTFYYESTILILAHLPEIIYLHILHRIKRITGHGDI